VLGLRRTSEACGSVDLERVRDISKTGVDRISIGKLTKDVKAIDLSMRVDAAY
jgi:nicotinate-nucleotide pyrophosphorylase (carboxylating)